MKVIVLPVDSGWEPTLRYAERVLHAFQEAGLQPHLDASDRELQKRVREALLNANYVAIVGAGGGHGEHALLTKHRASVRAASARRVRAPGGCEQQEPHSCLVPMTLHLCQTKSGLFVSWLLLCFFLRIRRP